MHNQSEHKAYTIWIKDDLDEQWHSYDICSTQFATINLAAKLSQEGRYAKVTKSILTEEEIIKFYPYEEL